MRLSIPLQLTGSSLSNTISLFDLFGIDRRDPPYSIGFTRQSYSPIRGVGTALSDSSAVSSTWFVNNTFLMESERQLRLRSEHRGSRETWIERSAQCLNAYIL